MTATTQLSFDAAGFESFIAVASEPDWLTETATRGVATCRSDAVARASSHEEWIRTDIRAFQIKKFFVPAVEAATTTLDTQSIHQLIRGVDLGGSLETIDSASHGGKPGS